MKKRGFMSVLLFLFLYIHNTLSWYGKKVLTVTKGTGVDFLRLWEMKRYHCGKFSSDTLRDGLIDVHLNSTSCPYEALVRFDTVKFVHWTHTSDDIYTWMQSTPTVVLQNQIDNTAVEAKLRPDNVTNFQLYPSGDPARFYIILWFDRTIQHPRFFRCNNTTPAKVSDVTDYIYHGGAAVDFVEENQMSIWFRYEEICRNNPGPVCVKTVSIDECIIINSKSDAEETKREMYYTKSETHNSLFTMTDVIWKFSGSRIICGATCTTDVHCLSFFYDDVQKMCYGYKQLMLETNSSVSKYGMVHFVEDSCI